MTLFSALLHLMRPRHRPIDKLSMTDERQLRDVGLEPQDILDAMNHQRSSVWLAPMRGR
jgi:uncharacterized protein YjiS (DUF1127 family)